MKIPSFVFLAAAALPIVGQTYTAAYTSALSGIAPWYWGSNGAWIATA